MLLRGSVLTSCKRGGLSRRLIYHLHPRINQQELQAWEMMHGNDQHREEQEEGGRERRVRSEGRMSSSLVYGTHQHGGGGY